MRRIKKTHSDHVQSWPAPLPAAKQLELCREMARFRRRVEHCRKWQHLAAQNQTLLGWSYYVRRERKAQYEYERVRNILWETNMRLVVREAGRFANRRVHGDDLVGIGAIHLRYVLEKFNPEFGTCLSTYLVIALRRRFATYIKLEYKRQPQFTHLHTEDQFEVLAAMVPAPSKSDYDQPTNYDWMLEGLPEVITQLPERDQYVLNSRMSGVTLQVISEQRGVSRERARQWEKMALDRLAEKIGVEEAQWSLQGVESA